MVTVPERVLPIHKLCVPARRKRWVPVWVEGQPTHTNPHLHQNCMIWLAAFISRLLDSHPHPVMTQANGKPFCPLAYCIIFLLVVLSFPLLFAICLSNSGMEDCLPEMPLDLCLASHSFASPLRVTLCSWHMYGRTW